jgi:hypothetical protein
LLSARRRFAGLILTGAVTGVLVAPLLWHNREAIYDYYFLKHLAGNERDIRAVHAGITSFAATITFYPHSVLKIHLGGSFLIVAAVALGATGLPRLFVSRDKSTASEDTCGIALIVLCISVPLALLTFDHDKSDVVGGMMVPPILWAVLLITNRLMQPPTQTGKHFMTAIACFALAFGVARQPRLYERVQRTYQDRQNLEAVNEFYDRMAALCRQRNWCSPRIATDCHADYLAPANLSVLAFERLGLSIDGHESLARLECYPDVDAIFDRLRDSDLVVLTEAPPLGNLYPFDAQMAQLHPRILAWRQSHFRLVDRRRIFDRDVLLFARAAS